jgi:hypothetical protein
MTQGTHDGWDVRWSRHLDQAGPGGVNAVAGAILDGRDVVVVAGSGGIAVWDAVEGEPVAPWQEALSREDAPTRLAVVDSVRDPVAVAGNSKGLVRLWDLRTGLPRQEPLGELWHRVVALAAAAVNDRVLALTTVGRWAYSMYDWGTDGGAEVWDVEARRRIRVLRHSWATTAVALAPFGGHACAAVAAYKMDPAAPPALRPEDAQFDDIFASLAVFNALTGEPLGPVMELGRNCPTGSLALGEVSGRLLAFSAAVGGGLQVVDVAEGRILPGPSWSDRVRQVVSGGPPHRPLVLATGATWEDPAAWLWDPQTGETLFEAPLRSGHRGGPGFTRAGEVILASRGELKLLRPPR